MDKSFKESYLNFINTTSPDEFYKILDDAMNFSFATDDSVENLYGSHSWVCKDENTYPFLSMLEFTLDKNRFCIDEIVALSQITTYATFLNMEIQFGMFLPYDINGKIFNIPSSVDELEKLKDVLFSFNMVETDSDNFAIRKKSGELVNIFKYNENLGYITLNEEWNGKRIEDLLCLDIKLTKNAYYKLGLLDVYYLDTDLELSDLNLPSNMMFRGYFGDVIYRYQKENDKYRWCIFNNDKTYYIIHQELVDNQWIEVWFKQMSKNLNKAKEYVVNEIYKNK